MYSWDKGRINWNRKSRKDFNQETFPSGDLTRETSGEFLSPVRRGQRAAAAVARSEPDGMTSSAAPAWNAAGEGAGCPVPIVRPLHPPASRSRAGVAERPWGPFPSAARAGMPQTALGSSAPVPVYCATLRFGCPEPSCNVTKPPAKSERPSLLRVGPARRPRPGQYALPRPAPTITSCRRARGVQGRARRRVPALPESRWAGLRRPGRGLGRQIPGRGRAAGSLRPCSARGGRAPSRAGHAARAAVARRGCQARPGPCPPPLGGATSGMFALS